jgi:fibro-slime domain-containing protein
MEDLPVDDELHTVPTVDNNQYGIEMRMYDLENGKTNDATGQMNAFLGNTTTNGMTTVHTPGLLSTDLVNGYPIAAGGSLDGLFAKGKAADANHLFIESIYRATGYYEYNSAQNFAKLTPGGDFVVYQELGTNDSTSKNTLKHGQFFPYNSIKPGYFASANGENLYSATGSLLRDSDARKHERLYLVEGDTDYYFAMELKASFEQTPSGLDAWGHDIIFEFSGDDDFWLYVDDELVIDLGDYKAEEGWYEITVSYGTFTMIVNVMVVPAYN